MRPINAYKDMLDNVVSPITCVSMNQQNQLEQIANGAMFATKLSLRRNIKSTRCLKGHEGTISGWHQEQSFNQGGKIERIRAASD
jgi:hypothetical protein